MIVCQCALRIELRKFLLFGGRELREKLRTTTYSCLSLELIPLHNCARAQAPGPLLALRFVPSDKRQEKREGVCVQQLSHSLFLSLVAKASWPAERALSSVYAVTRKIVNYAWRGLSPRKLWWKFVAIVTCKSMAPVWYRGERPIELSSSWFHPKFLSG